MTYATLMVHLQLGRSNAGLLQITAGLAERFRSHVIGIAACQPMQIVYGDGFVSGDIYAQDREEIDKQMKAAEAEFRSALRKYAGTLEWRSTVVFGFPGDYLAREARSADLVITGVASGDWLDSSRSVNTGDLVMQAGRPVLVAPAAANKLKLERVVVGWKDTREARRAVSDALPVLQNATHVVVVEIATEEDFDAARMQVKDVAGWLARHGVVAECLASPSTDDDATALYTIAQDQGADVIVAGAYGHSRLREWALGGVTRDLLLRANCCSLLSH